MGWRTDIRQASMPRGKKPSTPQCSLHSRLSSPPPSFSHILPSFFLNLPHTESYVSCGVSFFSIIRYRKSVRAKLVYPFCTYSKYIHAWSHAHTAGTNALQHKQLIRCWTGLDMSRELNYKHTEQKITRARTHKGANMKHTHTQTHTLASVQAESRCLCP